MSANKWRAGLITSLVLALVLGALGFAFFPRGGSDASAGPTPEQSASADNTCWKVVYDVDDPNGNVSVTGITGTADEVRAKYLKLAKTEPAALTALWNMSPAGVKAKVTNPSTLVDSSGCMTQDAKVKWWTLSIELSKAKVERSEAPANGCNSFVHKNKVIVKCGAISGNRKSTKITWEDGTVTHVMDRCANPVTPPHGGPTPTPTPTPSCTPPFTHGKYPICKDGPEKDPQSNGNVPPAGTKDHPSDDNASEVAKPPETPSDSGNGIPSGSSPRATPSPVASSTAPPSGGGNGTPGPSPTEPAGTASGAPASSSPATGIGGDF